MPAKPKFQEGEKVLCYHGPLLYEAKCVLVEMRDGKLQHRIHYNGWNKNWDEWVQETRMVKLNEAGIQKQRELLKNHGALQKKTKTAKKLEKELLKQEKNKNKEKEKEAGKQKEKASAKEKKEKEKPDKKVKKEEEKKEKERPSTPLQSAGDKRKDRGDQKNKDDAEKNSTTSVSTSSINSSLDTSISQLQGGEPKRKRARLDNAVESEDTYLSKIEVKIKIPDDLKPVLVDDWDLITRQKMLVSLPCKMTVDDIIEDYIKNKTTKNSLANKDAMIETMSGCKDYFNVMLGTQLLYKFERPQYGEIKTEHPDKPMSSIYGPIHFLRLFVRLGAMLAYTSLDERTVHILLNHIHDFLKYLSKNGPTYFKIQHYEIAPPDYHRKAI